LNNVISSGEVLRLRVNVELDVGGEDTGEVGAELEVGEVGQAAVGEVGGEMGGDEMRELGMGGLAVL
jgi:hypothetical protein